MDTIITFNHAAIVLLFVVLLVGLTAYIMRTLKTFYYEVDKIDAMIDSDVDKSDILIALMNLSNISFMKMTHDCVRDLEAKFENKYKHPFDMNNEEYEDDKILVENGDMFDGTREQFMDCYFSNASNNNIMDWCFDQGFNLSINGEDMFKKKKQTILNDEV